MYNRIKQELEESGEVMIKTDSGEERALHLHNIEFLEEPIAKVNGGEGIHWINLNKVERYWIHEEF
jgi:hypothetical protein